MLRVFVREVDASAAANVGGPVSISVKSFDIAPAVEGEMLRQQIERLELHLREPKTVEPLNRYVTREVVGVELL